MNELVFWIIALAVMMVYGMAYIIAKGEAEFNRRWDRNLGNFDDMEERK